MSARCKSAQDLLDYPVGTVLWLPEYRTAWQKYKGDLWRGTNGAFMSSAEFSDIEEPYAEEMRVEHLTSESPRLPLGARSGLFESLADFFEKFQLVPQVDVNKSDHHVTRGYEWGDICGDAERRAVALLRAWGIRGVMGKMLEG